MVAVVAVVAAVAAAEVAAAAVAAAALGRSWKGRAAPSETDAMMHSERSPYTDSPG